jgi:putative endonuclease
LYYVYILKCNDDTLYTGWTTDIKRRLNEHNISKKGSRYTRARRPVKICYVEDIETKSGAMKREAQIKKLCREDKQKLVKNFETI